MKSQRATQNLGFNTAATQEESYAAIERLQVIQAAGGRARCSDGLHEGDRLVAVRLFYLNKGGCGLQGACIECQKRRRRMRIQRCRERFAGKSAEEIRTMYTAAYGETKACSHCKESKGAAEFSISIGMECGLHNHCFACSIGQSQGNGGLRDFIFMPDKDGVKYVKKGGCERCGGTDKLAVDHILPIAKGGTDCIVNKQTLCVHCNSKKSDTIDCEISVEQICERYRVAAAALDFSDRVAVSQGLAKLVYAFRKRVFEDATLEEVRASVKAYAVKNNLGHNLDRIIGKIAVLFNKGV
jgi:hypothetical protein